MEKLSQEVYSKDGTRIVYDRRGAGPAVILVDGAMCYRGFGPMDTLADLLGPHFTVYNYDRRGRGESSDTQPFKVEREIEDLDALIQEAGGKANVFGTSSGGCLAVEAAAELQDKVEKLAVYEPAYVVDKDYLQVWKDYRRNLTLAIDEGRRGDAVALFMGIVGTPPEMVNGMRQSPMWAGMEAIAPTLVYDAAAVGDDRSIPVHQARKVRCPTLVINGTLTPLLPEADAELAKAIPHAQHRVLEGQSHDVKLEVLAPVLAQFFGWE